MSTCSRLQSRPQRGFTLVVVLVLIAAMTLLVMSQVRRSTSTQAMSVNSSRYLQAETAAQTVLRFCEAAMLTSVGEAASVRVTTPGVRGVDGPAWRDAAKWTASGVDFGASAIALPGVTRYECLYEDASGDLVPSLLANDLNLESGSFTAVCAVQPGLSPRMCKYRVTARVTMTGGAQLNLQSELRFAI
jgi:Tfp pilus assembly protein PilX